MNEYVWETCEELDKKIADRVRLIRKRRSISQEKLSKISNVSLGSIKRFETTGQISLLSLTKIAVALNIVSLLKNILMVYGEYLQTVCLMHGDSCCLTGC